MNPEEEKIRKILKRGMRQPPPGFSARVMQQINSRQTATQSPMKALKPLTWAFGFVALLAISISIGLESDFVTLQAKLLPYLSLQQMVNFIFSLLAFWILMFLSPWIKKRVYHLSGA